MTETSLQPVSDQIKISDKHQSNCVGAVIGNDPVRTVQMHSPDRIKAVHTLIITKQKADFIMIAYIHVQRTGKSGD